MMTTKTWAVLLASGLTISSSTNAIEASKGKWSVLNRHVGISRPVAIEDDDSISAWQQPAAPVANSGPTATIAGTVELGGMETDGAGSLRVPLRAGMALSTLVGYYRFGFSEVDPFGSETGSPIVFDTTIFGAGLSVGSEDLRTGLLVKLAHESAPSYSETAWPVFDVGFIGRILAEGLSVGGSIRNLSRDEVPTEGRMGVAYGLPSLPIALSCQYAEVFGLAGSGGWSWRTSSHSRAGTGVHLGMDGIGDSTSLRYVTGASVAIGAHVLVSFEVSWTTVRGFSYRTNLISR